MAGPGKSLMTLAQHLAPVIRERVRGPGAGASSRDQINTFLGQVKRIAARSSLVRKLLQGLAPSACIILLSGTLFGCDANEDRQGGSIDQERIERTKAERVKKEMDREAEQQLMTNFSQAAPEIERRITSLISVRDRLVFFSENSGRPNFEMHVVPSSIPWSVSCSRAGLEMVLGAWAEGEIDGGSGSVTKQFSLVLSEARLNEEQCRALVPVAGKRMNEIMGSP